MPDGGRVTREPRMDPMGRPLEGRRSQAITSISIIVSWICFTLLIFWATKGGGPELSARFFAAMACVAWLCAEAFGRARAMVWPTSALAIIGSLSLGFAVSLATAHLREQNIVPAIAIVTGVASTSMATYLFRFRLPGLVSPIITFAIVSLFLTIYGVDAEGISKLEGLSPRGILAALISSPIWLSVFALLGLSSLIAARWLDLKGDDFGMASARPLHLIGAGVTALIVGKLLSMLPAPWTLLGLSVVAVIGWLWALRINRVAVVMAVHLAIARPLILAVIELTTPNSLLMWRPDLFDWMIMLTAIIVVDLALWPLGHQISLKRNWTLGPGGRIPQPRKDMGFWWRYWPYA